MTAEINGTVCGETTVKSIAGKAAYVMAVQAMNIGLPTGNCGSLSQPIKFFIDGQQASVVGVWDNRQTNLLRLQFTQSQ